MNAEIEMGASASRTSCTIAELSAVDPSNLRKYLSERGQEPAYTNWKYFDADFNAGRVRGYAAVQNDDVVGFIGLIPFNAVLGGEEVETAWTCDWSVDEARAGPTVGLALLKSAIRSHPHVFHVGGNAITERIFSRLASFYDRDAVCDYAVHLTVSSHLDRLIARAPGLAAMRKLPLGRVPANPFAHRADQKRFAVNAGIAPEAVDVFAERSTPTALFPRYSAPYIQWQVATCPNLECYSCHADGEAAGLMWRSRESSKECRLAIAAVQPGGEKLEAVVRSLVHTAYEFNADIAKVRVSVRDVVLRDMLEQLGFRAKRHLPYFAFYENPSRGPSEIMSGLSFLDVDEANTGWT